MNILGKDDDVVGGKVGVSIYYLEPEFWVMMYDSEAVGSKEIKDFVEGGAKFRMWLADVWLDLGFNDIFIIFVDLVDFPAELFNSRPFWGL